MIRYQVHLRVKKGTREAVKTAHYAHQPGRPAHIDGIADFQHRRNPALEMPLMRGFNDMFRFDFRNSTVRDIYREDRACKAIGARIIETPGARAHGVFVSGIGL